VIKLLTATWRSSSNLYKLLLVVLLVISQFFLLLHQLDVEHHADAKDCTICLALHALDHGLAAGSLALTVEAAAEPPCILPVVTPEFCSLLRQVARSPPVSALHA
jgi:hypothetical protein